MEQAARAILKRHRDTDAKPADADQTEREHQAAQAIRAKARKIKTWLDDHNYRPGKGGTPIKSNITDYESAKIKTGKGVIQGYDGVACVDAKHQIVVDAQAFGEAQESFQAIRDRDIFKTTKLTADSGFYNTANVTHLYQHRIDGYLPDLGFRKRDPRFAQAERHRVRTKHDRQAYYGKTRQHYASPDFHYDAKTHACICPAGKSLYRNGRALNLYGYETLRFRGAKQTCLPCDQRHKCMKDPDKTQTRQVAIFIGRSKQVPPS